MKNNNLILEDEFTALYNNTMDIPQPVACFKIGCAIVHIYDKKEIPNRFRRFMQEKILGIKWEIWKG